MLSSLRNAVVSELSKETGADAATCSKFLKAFYSIRTRHLKDQPHLVAQFDATEMARIADAEEEAKAQEG